MIKEIEFTLPYGDQVDLECAIRELMIQRAKDNPDYASKNPWGEFFVLQGNILHGVQWSYVGDAEYDDTGKFIGMSFDDGEPDFEIDSSWWEDENYSKEEDSDE